ncbi:MAG: toprim domain-containing protein [Candidatus Campbellbacteria bacterium]|nr:toprim domain-containing protein [Candidatus Campbellbacteria bacterium]
MSEFEKLTELFRKFPGIGIRQAQRFSHFIVRQDDSYVRELVTSLEKTKSAARFCSRCQKLSFSVNNENVCSICSSAHRDQTVIMVVEKDADLDHIEQSGVYNGQYFVLGGVLATRQGSRKESIRLVEMEETLKFYLDKGLEEIVLALSLTPEGENTNDYLSKKIRSFKGGKKLKISTLGRGLSVGSELEYSDKDTLRYALSSRK